ncbi:Minichromosome maintenance domain-containing protein 2 [Chytridiales sp. JEL 0842]|nr:Minichromosome maintenance domain-containing protein 2 [Chytridiales sp. JEL 0842]
MRQVSSKLSRFAYKPPSDAKFLPPAPSKPVDSEAHALSLASQSDLGDTLKRKVESQEVPDVDQSPEHSGTIDTSSPPDHESNKEDASKSESSNDTRSVAESLEDEGTDVDLFAVPKARQSTKSEPDISRCDTPISMDSASPAIENVRKTPLRFFANISKKDDYFYKHTKTEAADNDLRPATATLEHRSIRSDSPELWGSPPPKKAAISRHDSPIPYGTPSQTISHKSVQHSSVTYNACFTDFGTQATRDNANTASSSVRASSVEYLGSDGATSVGTLSRSLSLASAKFEPPRLRKELSVITSISTNNSVSILANRPDTVVSVVSSASSGIIRRGAVTEYTQSQRLMAYLESHHIKDIRKCVFESQSSRNRIYGTINYYQCNIKLDPMLLMDYDPTLANDLLFRFSSSGIIEGISKACQNCIQFALGGRNLLLSEHVRVTVQVDYLPCIPEQSPDLLDISRTLGAFPRHLETAIPDLFGTGGLVPESILNLKNGEAFWIEYAPKSMWRKLKLSLLLSLVSTPTSIDETHPTETLEESTKRTAIHLLLISDDITPMMRRLIRHASSFRKSSEWHGTTPLVSVIENAKGVGQSTFPGAMYDSAITSAKDGILLVHIETLNKKNGIALRDVMDMTKKTMIQNGAQKLDYNSNLIVWGFDAIIPTLFAKNKAKRASKSGIFEESSAVMQSCSEAGRMTQSKFDIILNMQSSKDPTFEKSLSEHVLSQLNNPDKGNKPVLEITEIDFIRFIHAAANIEVTHTEECLTFLQAYFSSLRKLYGNVASGRDSMFVKMQSLVRIASAHAKLCLRDKAIIDDALASVLLVEETIALEKGVSALGFRSLPEDQENVWKLYGSTDAKPRRRSPSPTNFDFENITMIDEPETKTDTEQIMEKLYKNLVSLFDRCSANILHAKEEADTVAGEDDEFDHSPPDCDDVSMEGDFHDNGYDPNFGNGDY